MPERIREMLENALEGALFASRWLRVLLALSDRISEASAQAAAAKSASAEARGAKS